MTSPATLVEKGHAEVGGNNRVDKIESLKIYYEIHGRGPNKLFFVMGLNTTSGSWEYQVKYFGAHPDFQVCIFDNRGVGWSDAPSGLYSTSQMAQDAIGLMEHLEWTENIHVIGISMGGMIAQELVLLKPGYVRSLCLTSTTAGMTIPPIAAITTITRILFIKDPRIRINALVKILFTKEWLAESAPPGSTHKNNEERIIEDLRNRINRTRLQPVNGAIGQIAACLLHYVSPMRLQQIRDSIPQILVITGSWDNFVRPNNSFYLAEQLQADFEYWEGCGHVPCGEQIERYNTALENHFKKAGLIHSTRT
ncbi:alpha/beta-hydrolase [Gigaspora margarita]|uniref:Alpha/beta-hydrolase n=1 Tax=Gigaspora margarita TaxID=4874 RepID=A0A8H4AYB0_GIGMA|nr:alpha/beta-hydrolase [Gigaspora margarita]